MKLPPTIKSFILHGTLLTVITGVVTLHVNDAVGGDFWSWVLINARSKVDLIAAINDNGGINRPCNGDIFNMPEAKELDILIKQASVVYINVASRCRPEDRLSLHCKSGALHLSCHKALKPIAFGHP